MRNLVGSEDKELNINTYDTIFDMLYLIFLMFVPSYLQPNGYKPTPMDLTQVQLTEKMKELVELLAENTHNVWARERIKQGWTYGLNEVG